jgi:chromate transport protein ChrA
MKEGQTSVTPETPAMLLSRARLLEVIRYFLWLGVTGFGGPVALCGLMERDLVERRCWLNKPQMRDVIAVCQTMPGPLAVQVAIFVGHLRCGSWGAWAGGSALILPSSLMVAFLAATYVHLHALPWLTAIIYGVSPAVIALILHSWLRLVRLGMEDRFQYIVATISVVATLVLPGLLTAIFLGAGLLGVGWYMLQARRHDTSLRLRDVASFLLLAKLAWFKGAGGARALADHHRLSDGHRGRHGDSWASDDGGYVRRFPRGWTLGGTGLHHRHLPAFILAGSAGGSATHAPSHEPAGAGLCQGCLCSSHWCNSGGHDGARPAGDRRLGNRNDRRDRACRAATIPHQRTDPRWGGGGHRDRGFCDGSRPSALMPGDCQCASGRDNPSARTIVAHTGQGAVVPEGPPMASSSVGATDGCPRRSAIDCRM